MSLDVRLVERMPTGAAAEVCFVYSDALANAPMSAFLSASGFTGELGQVRLLPPSAMDNPAADAPMRVAVGLGHARDLDELALRKAGGSLGREVRRFDLVYLAVPPALAPGLTPPAAAAALVQGFRLGAYRFTAYRSPASERRATSRLDVALADPSPHARELVDRALRLADAVCLARDLGNEPGGSLTPIVLADRAGVVAKETGLEYEVWDRDRIEAERLGGLLGVARGSNQPPRLVRLDYRPPTSPIGTVALVGKGVTFDSGGLTLKPGQAMADMKLDMAGVATIVAAMSVLPALRCPVAVTGWLPLTDNMSGGDATRIGDVLRARNGTTIEVINADAEGRLLLADALCLAAEAGPDAIVDVATLTETVAITVGRRYGGLTGTHAGWQDQVMAAAKRAGEALWQLPLPDTDRHRLDSKIADLANAPYYRYGQSTMATMFLREFVPANIPWAHMDIAGAAIGEEDDGDWVTGATGYGVLTLVELLCGYRPPSVRGTRTSRPRRQAGRPG